MWAPAHSLELISRCHSHLSQCIITVQEYWRHGPLSLSNKESSRDQGFAHCLRKHQSKIAQFWSCGFHIYSDQIILIFCLLHSRIHAVLYVKYCKDPVTVMCNIYRTYILIICLRQSQTTGAKSDDNGDMGVGILLCQWRQSWDPEANLTEDFLLKIKTLGKKL